MKIGWRKARTWQTRMKYTPHQLRLLKVSVEISPQVFSRFLLINWCVSSKWRCRSYDSLTKFAAVVCEPWLS